MPGGNEWAGENCGDKSGDGVAYQGIWGGSKSKGRNIQCLIKYKCLASIVDASPLEYGGLLKLETPDSDEEEDNPHQEQDTELRQDLCETRIFCHNTVVAFEGMGVGGELGDDASKTF